MEAQGVEDVWSTEHMRENRHNWSLAADTSLLSYIQQFSQKLLNETHTTLKSLDSLESDLNTACVEADTVANKFLSLADTQFVENRVYDDEETSSPGDESASDFNKEKLDSDREKVIAVHINEALVNGLQVVSTKFKVVEIPDSDSEEDDSSSHRGIVLKPINPYQDRALPHLIGSVEFNHDDTLGLRDSQSDEETEEALSISDKAESETEDSEPESDQAKVEENNGSVDGFRSGVSFPEQLAARLGGVSHQENHSKSITGNMFTVPVEEDDSDSLFFGESHSSEEKSKNLFSDDQSPDLWAGIIDEDNRLFAEDKSMSVEKTNQSSSEVHQDILHSKYISSSALSTKTKRTGKRESLFDDDTDDGNELFRNVQQPDALKKKVPPGAVSIFGPDVDLFGKNSVPFLSASGSDKTVGTKPRAEIKSRVSVNRSENQVDDTLAVRNSVTPSKSSDSLPQAEEEDDYDDLFSSTRTNNARSSSKVKSDRSKLSKIASEPRNTVNRDDMNLSGDNFLSSDSSLFGNKKTSLFDSPGEDLFSSDDVFPSSSSRKPFKLFDDENLFSENKKSDLFDDLFVSSNTKFNENDDIFCNEDLFENKNSHIVTKDDMTFDKKISSNSGTVDYVEKENSDDLFLYSEPNNSDSLQDSESGLSRKHLSEDLFADNTSSLPGIKRSTENLFKDYSSGRVSDSENIFSHTSAGSKAQGLFTKSSGNTLQASKETLSATQNIFSETNDGSDNDDIFSNLGTHNRLTSEHNKVSGTTFRNILSSSASVKPVEKIDVNYSNNADSSISNKNVSNINKLQNSPDLFGDDDEDDNDLFKTGSSKKLISKNKAVLSPETSKNYDNSNAHKTTTRSEISDVKTLFTDDTHDLFGTGVLNFSGHGDLSGTKTVNTAAKSKKLRVTCPLFDESDSDDDLFSSPRGSLGSKKSQSSVNLSQDINPLLKKNLLEDVSVRKQNESMEYDLFKALRSTSKNNYLFADISDGEGHDDGDLFDALKPSDAKQKISGAENIDKHNIACDKILSSAKSEQRANESLQKERINKQWEPLTVSSVKTDLRSDCEDSLVSENTVSPGKLNADHLPKIDPSALLPGIQPRIITSSSKMFNTEQNLFPLRNETSTLYNIVKDRVKIQVKRRLPSRRARQEALRVLASDEHENVSSKDANVAEDYMRIGDSSTIMSPSTDEEDMFGVPPLEIKVSFSPTDIFNEPTIVSSGQSSIFTRTIQHSEFVTAEDSMQTDILGFEHTSTDSLSGSVKDNFHARLFEKNLKGADQSNDSTGVHSISTEDFVSTDSDITKLFIPKRSKLSGTEYSGNVSTTVSDNKDKASLTTRPKKLATDFFSDFDDSVSENLFCSNLESKPKSKLPNRKSLFDDEDEDVIFCTSSSASSSKAVDTVQKKSSESGSSKSNISVKRPVKLTSHQAFTDPLMSNED